MSRIRVLVVDDSVLVRQVVTGILSDDPEIEVIGAAVNGREMLRRATTMRPDVITLDVEMPVMNGLAALEELMAIHPTPVVMLSGWTREGAEATVRALELGAVDFVTKPTVGPGVPLDVLAHTIVDKVKTAARARLRQRRTVRRAPVRMVAIASSTGGPAALTEIFTRLPPAFPVPIVIVQHMPAGFTRSLAARLDAQSALTVREAEAGDTPEPGAAYMAPGGQHLLLCGGRFVIDDSPPVGGLRPCADVTLKSLTNGGAAPDPAGRSAASGSGTAGTILGVVLTGMGSDGLEGCRQIRRGGGMVVAQNEDTSVVYGMPRAVVEAGLADLVLPLDRIAIEVDRLVRA